MNPNRTGWFDTYIEFRRAHPFPERLPTFGVKILEDTGLHNESDQAIYFFVQPTGLLYGAPLERPFPDSEPPTARFQDRSARAMTIHLDTIMACLVAERRFLLSGLDEESDPLDAAVNIVQEYHLLHPPEFRSGPRPVDALLGLLRRRGGNAAFEEEFARRVSVSGNLLLLRTPIVNIFLFLDLYHCLLWQRKCLMEGARAPEGVFAQYREQIAQREALLKLIVATLYTDRRVHKTGWQLIERFLRASMLPPERQIALRRIAKTGIAFEDIEMPEMPWLIRRYFLGLTVMTAYLDRNISAGEEALIAKAVEKLGLWPEEMGQSRTAFEAFLLSHEREFSFGQARNVFNVAEHLSEQASLAIKRNLDRVVREIKETQELYELLLKSTRQSLTPDEKRRVRNQLLDIVKTVPALAIFALPGGGIILPILIRLLPFNLLPSSFED